MKPTARSRTAKISDKTISKIDKYLESDFSLLRKKLSSTQRLEADEHLKKMIAERRRA